LQTNVAMRFKVTPEGQYVISGRGELHLSVFLETLRREGFEMEVGKPNVITKIVDGKEMEPVEELTIDVDSVYVGAIKSEVGKRRGSLMFQEQTTDHSTKLMFEISTRGIIGLRGVLLTLSKGTAVLNSSFIKYEKKGPDFQKLRKGVIVASTTGTAVAFGLAIAQDKGPVFIGPQTPVYEGMIVGINGRDEDMEINVCKEKQLTNIRSAGEDNIMLAPHMEFSLEQYIGFLEDDELLEITPKNMRLRKKILDKTARFRASKK
jgi:GTP-binding protein